MRAMLTAAVLSILVVALLPAVAGAQGDQPIDFDLNEWSQEGVTEWGTWEVEPDGLTVRQTVNHSPTFFVSPETFATASIEGVFEVETSGDDDYIGFVMGYAGPRSAEGTDYDFIAFNWKQGSQNFGGCQAEEGASLVRVQGSEDPDADYTPGGTAHPALWCHESRTDGAYDVDAEVLDTNWGDDTGWEDETEYTFTLEYSPTAITVSIDGTEVLSATGDFPDGAFGFYNYSQSDVRYSGFAVDESGPEPEPGEPGVSRIDGAGTGDPIDTALEICQFLVDDGEGESVALARGDDFADALAGSALPADCILYTEGGPDAPLSPDTRAEIQRALGPDGNVFVLGGENAVSAAAADTVTADGYTVGRLEGPTRYETAEAVADAAMAEVALAREQVIVANGDDWADAVTVGAYAHATTTPIVLTPTEGDLHPAAGRVVDTVTGADAEAEVVLVGGEAVVGPAVEAAVPNPRRVAGANRMGTAVAIAEQLWRDVPATGEDFVLANLERADAWTIALASAPLAAELGGPQLGLRADSYPSETRTYLEGLGLTDLPSVVLLGDLGFISDEVATEVEGSVDQE